MRLRTDRQHPRPDWEPPDRGRPRRYCLGCGYYLDGLPRTRCPECGREFNPDDRKTYGPSQTGDAEIILFSMTVFGWFVTAVALAGPHARAVVLLVTILQAVVCTVSWSGRPKCPELEPTRYRLARRAWIGSGLYIAIITAAAIRWIM